MPKFKNKYRIESTRLKGWDYTSPGYYFVTICTKNHEPFFGHIQNGKNQLSPLGKIAHQSLDDIPQHFPHTKTDTFVVMPNHVHAIVVIHNVAETPHVASLQKPKRKFGHLKPGSLSKIIQAYKAAVTRQAHKTGYMNFAWQSRFYDHIIRNEKSLQNIRRYIVNNPLKWKIDEHYPANRE